MRNTIVCLTLLFIIAPSAYAIGGKGMTWVKMSHDATYGIDHVGCNNGGNPKLHSCNAYEGDTSCQAEVPILCLKVDNSPSPPYLPGGDDFYDGWAAGHIASTLPVKGTELNSRTAGSKICKAAFGVGWRMAEFHDNRVGGWGFAAYGDVHSGGRYWVKIDDQPANCWN